MAGIVVFGFRVSESRSQGGCLFPVSLHQVIPEGCLVRVVDVYECWVDAVSLLVEKNRRCQLNTGLRFVELGCWELLLRKLRSGHKGEEFQYDLSS